MADRRPDRSQADGFTPPVAAEESPGHLAARRAALGGVTLLAADLPEWKDTRTDFNYWYFGTMAVFQVDGPDGPTWKTRNPV